MSILTHSPAIVRDGLVLCLDAGLNRSTNALADTGHPTKAGLTYGGPGVEEDYQPTGCKLISRADKTISHGNDLRAYDSNTQGNWAGPATGAGAYFTKVSGSSSNGFFGYLNTGYGFTSNPVVGRRYRILMRAKSTSSIHLRHYDGAGGYHYFSADVGTTLKTYTYDFTCLHATGTFVYGTGSFSDGETAYFDRYEVYELSPWLDVSGHDNHGDMINAPTFSTESGAGGTRSFDFDGTADNIECGDSAELSFGDGSSDSPFSVSAWIKMDDATNFGIISKGAAWTDAEYFFMVSGADKLDFTVLDESVNAYEKAIYNTALTSYEGDWIHVAATYSGVGGTSANAGISLYLNGNAVATTLSGDGTYAAMENLAGGFRIGRYSSDYGNGRIAMVHVYSRALTATEVAQNYRTHKGRFGR